MRNLVRNILIASVILSLNASPIALYAMPEPVPAAQTDKQKAAAAKAKEAEKKKKEAEKAKAAKEKEKAKAAAAKDKEKAKAAAEKAKAAEAKKREAEKKKAEAAKETEKKQAERDKVATERAKAAEERAEMQARKEAADKAKEEKALRDYEKYQESLENPKTEVISYFNLGLRLGYAAMMDKINGSYMGAGTLNQSNALQQLKGGPGAGLNVTYNLEYGHFLFETGLDFRFLNSTSTYGFQATRNDLTYPGTTYTYLFDNLRETRNMLEIGLPLMFGAQFSRYYFLLGAKVYYGLPMGYSHKGMYDIVVNDPAMLEPYGMGIHELNGQTDRKISFKQPDVSLAAEIGIDLDEWLQAQPEKKKAKVKAGERQPFGREHVHYRVGLFAEYGVLNTNGTPKAYPVEFATNSVEVQKSNTLLAMNGDTKLNNLFVGAKFTIQFEVPGKTARPVPPPPAYAIYSVVDAETNQPLDKAFIQVQDDNSGKIALREKQITAKGLRQKHGLSNYTAKVKAEGYYEAVQGYEIKEVGSTEYITIAMRRRPVFRVRVTDKETGLPLRTTIELKRTGVKEPLYTLTTDSVTGSAREMLAEGTRYSLHIVQMGYERLDIMLTGIGDSLNLALNPVKKGEVFIVKNLHFATNKTRILKNSEEALQELHGYLSRNPKVRIKIIGHTDNVGKDDANKKLSEGRANAVMQDLIERGIAPERLQAEGRGESQPIDTNDTEEGRQNNRRVEIEIL